MAAWFVVVQLLTTGNAQNSLPKWLKEGVPHCIIGKDPVLRLESKELGQQASSNSIKPEREVGKHIWLHSMCRAVLVSGETGTGS